MEPATIADVITNLTAMVTATVTWIGQYMGAVMANPLLTVMFSVSLVGIGIGAIKRLAG